MLPCCCFPSCPVKPGGNPLLERTRDEYEIPDAVTYAIEKLGERFRVFPSSDAVLDLSSREDIATLWPHLEHLHVDL